MLANRSEEQILPSFFALSPASAASCCARRPSDCKIFFLSTDILCIINVSLRAKLKTTLNSRLRSGQYEHDFRAANKSKYSYTLSQPSCGSLHL